MGRAQLRLSQTLQILQKDAAQAALEWAYHERYINRPECIAYTPLCIEVLTVLPQLTLTLQMECFTNPCYSFNVSICCIYAMLFKSILKPPENNSNGGGFKMDL